MTWGACYMYYRCPECGHRFKYAVDLIEQFGEDFGKCPACKGEGELEHSGALIKEDRLYEEVE